MTWCFPLGRLARTCYNLLLAILAPLAIPYWMIRSRVKGHSWSSFPEAFGAVPRLQDRTARPPVWFHAVSVGEVQAALPFLRSLRRVLPETPICVSTGTPTGRRLAEEKLAGVADLIFRAPLDLPWCVSRVFARLRPRLLVVAETELWPNYFYQAERYGAATLIVNARMSDRSAPKYRALRFFFQSVLARADAVLAQSETDRERFLAAGADAVTTVIGGNLKYDFADAEADAGVPDDLSGFLDRAASKLLLVAGSTRETEEATLAPVLRALADREPGLLAVVAPRHPGRFAEAERALVGGGLTVIRRTAIAGDSRPQLPAVLLLNSLGELAPLYRRSDLAFVGGSLNGWGGHNVLEPVLFGKAVVVGPTMQNFRQITADLLGARGIVQVANADALRTALLELASDEGERNRLGEAGKEWAESQRGASDHAADRAAQLYRRALPRVPPSTLAAFALGPFAAAWSFGMRVRRAAYRAGVASSRRLSLPVVSVGNLTVGGTGKTPTVAWLVENLARRGRKCAVLTRGYGRKSREKMLLVEPQENADPLAAGDEPAMLARRFATNAPQTVLAVGADRHASGQLIQRSGDTAILILDDGFQHLRLERSLNLVLVDATEPFGNGHVLPLGRLRERPASLRDADAVLITRADPASDQATLRDALRRYNPDAPIFHSRMAPSGLINLRTNADVDLNALRGEKVAAFCGIGNPESFVHLAREIGCDLVLARAYRDHHRYSDRDLESLAEAAASRGAQACLTTVKDAVNLSSVDKLPGPVYALSIDLVVDQAEELLQLVLDTAGGDPSGA